MNDVRVAAAQIASRGDLEANLAKRRDFAARASEEGANVVWFPELSLSGYPLDGDLPHELARPLDGEPVQPIAVLADELGIVVLAGMLERAPSGILYNTQLIASPGRRPDAYRKTHVPTSEIGRFRPGGEAPVFTLEHAVVGVQICYDCHFPETTTVQALAGAEVIFIPMPRQDRKREKRSVGAGFATSPPVPMTTASSSSS